MNMYFFPFEKIKAGAMVTQPRCKSKTKSRSDKPKNISGIQSSFNGCKEDNPYPCTGFYGHTWLSVLSSTWPTM